MEERDTSEQSAAYRGPPGSRAFETGIGVEVVGFHGIEVRGRPQRSQTVVFAPVPVPALDDLPALLQSTGQNEHERGGLSRVFHHVQMQMQMQMQLPAAGLDAADPQAGDPGHIFLVVRCGSRGQ
ncbi:hypothetical protein [Streptomyces yunnanensis]|uniref:hypothetical protein n=1 Tax=Streptomyces yunnanensis TaxID=156453 RepID=UPI002570C57A|nr:hypothetical protein [Streptomyces yunnanensis]